MPPMIALAVCQCFTGSQPKKNTAAPPNARCRSWPHPTAVFRRLAPAVFRAAFTVGSPDTTPPRPWSAHTGTRSGRGKR
eukprot:scaffold28917_cov132-Isochrysis_galbana.AAC.2